MISIALCTYNGSRFLREQLASLAAQERQPDELVISDDLSSDETISIAGEFAESAPFPVRILRNEKNVGSTKNFERAIAACSGDIIALCDQDDFWLPQKLKLTEAEFAKDPTVGLVFSDAALTDENLRPIGVRLWQETFRRRDQQMFEAGRALEVLLQYNVVTGAAMAFRSVLKPVVLPIPILTEFIHDGWISLAASMCSQIRFIREPLIKYRQHPGQQLGAGLSRWGLPRVERFRLTVESRARTVQRLDEFLEVFTAEKLDEMRSIAPDRSRVPDRSALERLVRETQSRIDDNVEHLKARVSLSESRLRRVPEILAEMRTGRYDVHSRGWQSALLDIVRK